MEAGVQGATQAGDEEREGEVYSPNSWPEVRAGQSEGAATNLRDFQQEKRRGECMCIYLLFPVYNVLLSWTWINYQTEIYLPVISFVGGLNPCLSYQPQISFFCFCI